ncbi:MAG: AAA family ATPase [Planctomycetota bacterium]|nr:AAA family ATPase [Planctomycetota bacterium]
MAQLKRIELSGFKSIKQLDLELRSLNVMIGANGAGKSNLVLFFKMLNEMMGQRLQQFIGTSGRAHSLLHYGPKKTPQMQARLVFDVENGEDTYIMRLADAAVDTLIFVEERLEFLQTDWRDDPKKVDLGAGHRETGITNAVEQGDQTAVVFRRLLNRCRVYQFHDTSPTARVRRYCYVDDDRWLMPDAGNLAAVLNKLKKNDDPKAYRRIVGTIRQIAPYFDDFDLEPNGTGNNDIALNWREKSSDQLFGPHQISDGTLRAMALITLLLQPVTDLPDVMVIDEPELGLHPFAKNILASLMKKASRHCQIIVATQSAGLLDGFEPEDIVVVERDESGSVFERQNSEKLKDWLDEYTLRELWEKNVLGGGPA